MKQQRLLLIFQRVPVEMKSLCRSMALLLCLLALQADWAFAADKQQINLQLKWYHQFQFAGYYAAAAKGYYRDEGLDVNIVQGGPQKSPINMVLNGIAQFAVGDTDILLARMQGKPVVAVAAVFQHSPYILMSRRDHNIQSPADLVDKRVMLSNDQGLAQFKAMLMHEGISTDKITILPHSWNLDDLIQGKVDAMSAYATVEPAQLSARGVEPAILNSSDYGADFYGDILFTTQAEASSHEERVDAFLRASQKGWGYALSHPEEIADLIMKLPGVQQRGLTRQKLLQEARDMHPLILPDIVEIGHMNPGRWQQIADNMANLGMAPPHYNLSGFIYEPHRVDSLLLRWITGIALMATGLIALVLLWNAQMRRQVRIRTEALRAEINRRQQAEELLKIAGSTARLGGWVLDVHNKRVTWSDEVAAIHEMPPGTSPTLEEGINLFAPECRSNIEAAVNACIRDGTPYDLELQKITASGRLIWVRTIGQAMRDASGNIIRLQGAFQDITEQKNREASLLQSETKLAAVFNQSYLFQGLMAYDGTLIEVNDSALNACGYQRENEIGKKFWDCSWWNQDPAISAHIRELIRQAQQGNKFQLVTDYHVFSGERRQSEFVLSPIRSRTGEVTFLLASGLDVTERKRLEAFKVGQNAILERIAAGAPLTDILHAAVSLIETQFPDCLCSVLLLDNDGRRLRSGAAIKLHADYMQALEGVEIGNAVGSCGTAAFEQRQVVVSDIANDPLWADYRDLALKYGLHACWSAPVFSSQHQVLGTFAVYYLTTHTPSAEELELVGSCSHIVGIAIERHKSQEQLNLLETSVSRLNDIVLITEAEPFADPGPRIVFVNDAFERLTGYSREEAIGKTPRILQGAKTQRSELERIHAALNKWEPVRAEVINYKKNGEEIWLELDIVPIADANGWYTHWVAVERDITNRKQAESRIQHLAFYDPLTGLPNRLLLLDRLEKVLADITRTRHTGALLFIDLDNFKTLNDTLGHDIGDMLLQQVAKRLQACVRERDTVARLGGDEFVVMLDDLNEHQLEASTQAKIVGEKILISFNQPFKLNGNEHHSTPSIGVTLFNDQLNAVDVLLKRADIAMYQAKASGRNTMRFFDPEMQAAVSARASMEASLRQALQQQQFLLYYQPQVDADGRVFGLEALLRWQHAEHGMVPPAEFIPLAEETGLILPIGQWVLATACSQLVAWAKRPQTAHLSIAVNVSARQFRHAEFVEQVQAVLNDTGANPQRLKLELTEGLLLDNIEDTIAKMSALKARGVGFSLDDFGTGYSSLSYLKKLPLDQLKIDQSFVRDVLEDPNDAAITRTIIALGQSLGLAVIAEGVETEQQRDFLAHHGCLAYQGYLFSKPLPVKELEAFMSLSLEA